MNEWTMDLLVNLYCDKFEELQQRAGGVDVAIRPALPPELHIIQDWVRRHFSAYWVSEVTIALARQPSGCLIATIEGELVGFACYDTTARGFFGPTGVRADYRGRGIGTALLARALEAMKGQGYAYAIIGCVGPAEFYRIAADAYPIPSIGSVYQRLLRPSLETETAP
jgi:GNAT superfamily N-acetyltransferase